MKLRIQACKPENLDLLVQISRSTFNEAFRHQNNPEDFVQYLDTAFHPGQLNKELQNADSFFYFVFDEETLAGYFKLNQGNAQTELGEDDGLELERIYVIKKFQGRKIGQWMLSRILELAGDLGKSYVWLGVWEHNPQAIRFYEKQGFRKFGTHPYLVGSDRQTDWLMRIELATLGPTRNHCK